MLRANHFVLFFHWKELQVDTLTMQPAAEYPRFKVDAQFSVARGLLNAEKVGTLRAYKLDATAHIIFFPPSAGRCVPVHFCGWSRE
jgi:hypothetical protein